ncbi:SLC13 family permease [Pelagerythrobacter rhizovicinus]|uniref:Anion transporter n=1 Tax=Pelagerythrobacter rhizovicinus TaxID=2268576 RepID=A0A4Q2KLE6_9SPHN|nr:SLC13 family permease [Pelagerythrobacter rhizovicinus]RXZ64292.1 anion transporter [Pelagerythrobacter rhizovicinus]
MADEVRHQGQYEDYAENVSPDPRSPRLTWLFRALGPAIALAVWLALGGAQDMPSEARYVAAVAALMAVWWMTEAIPLAATSLLPIVLIPMFTDLTVVESTAPYANSIVFLFLGGFLIAIAMEKWNLHRRIALLTLARVGTAPRQIILGLMLATGFLSMWVSNTATTLMMLPIGLSVIALISDRSGLAGTSVEVARAAHRPGQVDLVPDENIRRFAICLMLAIAWSASMGGLGTVLGSPPNAIVAGYAATEPQVEIGFLDWMLLGTPAAFTFILIGWVLMTRLLYRFDLAEVPGGRQMIEEEINKLGRFSQGEAVVTAVFAAAAFLWVAPGLLSNIPALADDLGWFGQMDDTAVAIAAGIAMFILPGRGRREMVLNWKDAEDGLPWGVLLLFGGGLSLASAVAATGLDKWLGTQVSGLGTLPLLLLMAAVVTIVIFLTEVTSNTATAATFIPVLGGVALGIGADPLTLLIPAALAATCAFMLPVGTPPNAIVFSTGAVTIADMARGGVVLNFVGIVLITLFCYLLGGATLGLRF